MYTQVTDPISFPHTFDAALNSGDIERLLALYDESAVIRVQSGEVRSGIAAVRAEMTALITAQAEITNSLRHIFRHDKTALIIVDYTLRIKTPVGTLVVMTGTATNVIEAHPERGWRMIVANPQGIST